MPASRARSLRRRLEASPLTVLVGLASLALSLPVIVPGGTVLLPALFELRGGDAATLQPWRLLTGHLVHLSGRQLVLNLAAFLWLGALCEPKMPRRYGSLLLGSALAVSAGVLLLHPALGAYRGLSGIASAQFAALVVLRLCDTRRRGAAGAALPLLTLLLFFVKTAYELGTGRGLFTGSLGLAGAGASPAAHLFGALAGLVVALLPKRSCSTHRSSVPEGVDRPLPLISTSRVG